VDIHGQLGGTGLFVGGVLGSWTLVWAWAGEGKFPF
jgi:hypothetical protein